SRVGKSVLDPETRPRPLQDGAVETVNGNGHDASATPAEPGTTLRAVPPRHRRRTLALAVLIPLLLIVGILGARWLAFSRTHASTDDATIDGDVYSVSAKVGGRVRRVLVGSNQTVQAGQLLMELDARDIEAQLAQARAALAIE